MREPLQSIRVVIDTGLFISTLFNTESAPAQAVAFVLNHMQSLRSSELAAELEQVMNRPKFVDRFSAEARERILRAADISSVYVAVTSTVQDCRDPKDDMLLALALDGSADLILTGDLDLLVLHPWRGIDSYRPLTF